MQRIIYKQDDGAIALVCPAPEALAHWGIMAIARKDVPEGKPFKIIDEADMPADLNAWTVADAELTDGVGAPGNSFPSVDAPAAPVAVSDAAPSAGGTQ
jgi:hypothetical protein